MRKVRAGSGAQLREFTAEDDHVHLMADYPPKAASRSYQRDREPPI
jgi:REP element-mobilizing transposase RayT